MPRNSIVVKYSPSELPFIANAANHSVIQTVIIQRAPSTVEMTIDIDQDNAVRKFSIFSLIIYDAIRDIHGSIQELNESRRAKLSPLRPLKSDPVLVDKDQFVEIHILYISPALVGEIHDSKLNVHGKGVQPAFDASWKRIEINMFSATADVNVIFKNIPPNIEKGGSVEFDVILRSLLGPDTTVYLDYFNRGDPDFSSAFNPVTLVAGIQNAICHSFQ